MFTLGVLASGKGSNLQAFIDAVRTGRESFRVGVVISDRADAFALDRARAAGIEAVYLPPGDRRTVLTPDRERAYADCLADHRVDLVCLAGFMRVVKGGLLERFPRRIINIHPSLLPAFPGLEAWKQAFDYGVKFTGCTVHYVEAGIDTGPIIAQAVVPVLPGDTPASVHERIQEQEHRIYPEAVRWIAAGRINVSGRRTELR